MLVCNVSLRPPRLAIAADLIETVTAADDLGSGQVVFATLVDDPASVNETVDAYVGLIMLEAATATDDADAAFAGIIDAAIVEAATAADTQDGALAAVYATFDGTATGVTLSNGNLTVTHTNTSGACGARSTSNRSTGKYYFEVTVGATHGGGDGAGTLLSIGSISDMNSGAACALAYLTFASGAIYSSNANTGSMGSAAGPGDIVCVAMDLGNSTAWFRRNNNIWNNNGSANPATNVGGVPLLVGYDYAPAVHFGSSASAVGDNMTANFGQTAFTYTVPSGFTSGWPA